MNGDYNDANEYQNGDNNNTNPSDNTTGNTGGNNSSGINYNLLQGMINYQTGQNTGLNTQGQGQTLPEYMGTAESATATNQALQNAGYDFSQPLTDIELPNRIAVPERTPLPDNFDFQRTYQNADVGVGRINHIDTTEQQNMLQQMTDLQRQQAELKANRAVETGTVNLQRAMQDAQRQFETQQNQIAMDERRALDNQVLYSEARGDRGGVGQAQYNTIQNTAATNRLTVQKEQTQLATDTARQIADLRSQGEFEKANQLLAISQQYLSQLMDLYQWAQETNLGIDEFNLQVAQWEENFKLQLVSAELDADAFNLSIAKTRMEQENNIFNALYNQENSLFDARLNAAKLGIDQKNANLNAILNIANATGAFQNGTPTQAARQFALELLAQTGLGLVKEGQTPSALELQAMGIPVNADGTGVVGGGTGSVQAWLSSMGYSNAESAVRAIGAANGWGPGAYAGILAVYGSYENFLAQAFGLSTDLVGTQTGVTPGTTPGVTPGINPGTTPGTTQVSQDLASWLSVNGYASATDALRALGYGNDGIAGLALYGYTPESFLTQILTENGIISPTTQTPSTGTTPTITPTYDSEGNPDISGITSYEDALAFAQALEQAGISVDVINDTIDRMIEQLNSMSQQPGANTGTTTNPGTTNPGTTGNNPTVASWLAANGYGSAVDALHALGYGDDGIAGLALYGYTPESYLANLLGLNSATGTNSANPYQQVLTDYENQTNQAINDYVNGVNQQINDYLMQLQFQQALLQNGLG